MTTYSQSLTGINAGSCYAPKIDDVPDADAAGNCLAGTASFIGAQQGNMMRGNQILVKGPDGGQFWATIDAERSVPGVSLILRPVGP